MQLVIRHETKDKLILPVNYHHILQSAIYKQFEADDRERAFVHDRGWKYEGKPFRMFLFSGISGHYELSGKTILFDGQVSWEFRTPDTGLFAAVKKGLSKNGIDYAGQKYGEVSLSAEDKSIEGEDILIRMRTPMCAYTTDPVTRKTTYYSPGEEKFSELVRENFAHKYSAYTGIAPEGEIVLIPVSVSPKDKTVTRYKNFIIEGWKGTYRLKGGRKYLDFLYQTGLGAKNAQGFGMFDVIS